jgi:phosphonate transport system substrate-binding protein
MTLSRRLFLFQAGLLLATSCSTRQNQSSAKLGRLLVGAVTYGEGLRSIDQYQQFIRYLETQLKTLIELEPVFNEVKAVEQIQRQVWSLVFAPPGLAAIAVKQGQYAPLFPLQGVNNLSSVLVVLKTSSIQTINQVNGRVLALGQPGSATGYYVPLYELYGTVPAEVRIASTPKTVLEWVAQGQVAVGALARDEFDRYRQEFKPTEFRILHTSRRIPAGAVLISPTIERNQQEQIRQAMSQVTPAIAEAAGYIPNAQPPDYKTLITFIEKVKPIETRIQEKPAPLYQVGEVVKQPG